jgi:hypothetical protein
MNKKKMIYSIVFGLSVTIILYIVLEAYLFLYFDYYIYTSISLIFGFGFYYFSDKIKNLLKESTKSENVSDTGLSIKYKVLEIYKGLAYLFMLVYTGFFIYSLVQYFDLPKVEREMSGNVMIATTITYVITMFSLFCLTKMIDFLFDLDKQDKILVSDKISSEEE